MLYVVLGGDEDHNDDLLSKPDDYETYLRWRSSAPYQESVAIGFEVIELWTLMRQASDGAVRGRADDVQNAYRWITEKLSDEY